MPITYLGRTNADISTGQSNLESSVCHEIKTLSPKIHSDQAVKGNQSRHIIYVFVFNKHKPLTKQTGLQLKCWSIHLPIRLNVQEIPQNVEKQTIVKAHLLGRLFQTITLMELRKIQDNCQNQEIALPHSI